MPPSQHCAKQTGPGQPHPLDEPNYPRRAAPNQLPLPFPERFASCAYCGEERESNKSLPFFRERPTYSTDSFYCGCKGWD